MYSLTSANRYYLYQGFVRMNLGIDGLFKIIRSQMKELAPISGDIFLFFGKNRQSVKILRWDGDGFLLYYKRLEGGSFELPTFNPHTGNSDLLSGFVFYLKWSVIEDLYGCENVLESNVIYCILAI